ncbi:MAG: nitrous oxide reductase family maturation protein NosD [Candidatus Thorarchaeota archaeon]
MKSITRSNLIIGSISLVLTLTFMANFSYTINMYDTNLSNNYEFTINKDNLGTSIDSAPIHIDDSDPAANWSVAKDAGICTGNGTYSDPYVIKNLEINAARSGSCILIENSIAFFRIEGCTLTYAGGSFGDAGITLDDVRNAQIVENDCSSNDVGILLLGTYYCSITDNTVRINDYIGIWVYDCDYNNISGNNVYSNDNYGFEIRYSSNNYISGNTVNYNEIGFALWNGYGNNVTGNSIISNNIYGIKLDNSHEYIIGNNINGNGEAGIYVHHSSGNEIIGNTIINNDIGIHLYSYNTINNEISGNTISLHSNYGIYLEEVEYNDIAYNTITNNEIGIYSHSSENNEISGNYYSDNNEDIRYYSPIPPEISFILILSILVIIGISIITTGMIAYERKVHSSFPAIGTLSIIFNIIGILLVAFTFNLDFSGTDMFNVLVALPFTVIGLLIGYFGFLSKKDRNPTLVVLGAIIGAIFSLISAWPLLLLLVAAGVA